MDFVEPGAWLERKGRIDLAGSAVAFATGAGRRARLATAGQNGVQLWDPQAETPVGERLDSKSQSS